MRIQLGNKKFNLELNNDVNIFVGKDEKSKYHLMSYLYSNLGVKAEYLSLFYIAGRLKNVSNITNDIESIIFNSCKNNNAVFIDLIGDLLFIENQQRLINKCLEINPNVQLFINTNSPSILYEGWEARPINVDELINS